MLTTFFELCTGLQLAPVNAIANSEGTLSYYAIGYVVGFNWAIAFVCFAIAFQLLREMMKQGKLLRPRFSFVAAGLFICWGTTHSLNGWSRLEILPDYMARIMWYGMMVASVGTFFCLLDLIPQALKLYALISDNNRLRESSETKREFLANMSHEIRTPLTAILGYAEMLKQEISQEERDDAQQTILRNGKHLLTVLNDILDYSKIESGKLDIERVGCSPIEILQDCLELNQVRAEQSGIELQQEIEAGFPDRLSCDPVRLKQILLNLIGNAVKFTQQGSVVVSLSRVQLDGEDTMRFEVTDTGIGMSKEQVEHLFVPFHQADSSITRTFGGSGLGLAISRKLVAMMEGRIYVKSQQGQGSCFTVDLPVINPIRLKSDLTILSKNNIAAIHDHLREEVDQKSLHILLVEDGIDNQRLVQFILSKAGFTVEIAENGQVALDMYEANPDVFDLILMDMQMPVMDGYTATRQLRQIGCTIPIIALTAHAMTGDRQECLALGCDEYLTKPIDRALLVETIKKFHLEWLSQTTLCTVGTQIA